jgi:hypothetical protein
MRNWRSFRSCISLLILGLAPERSFAWIVELEPTLQVNASAPSQRQNASTLSWTGRTTFGGGCFISVEIPGTPLFAQSGLIFSRGVSETIANQNLIENQTRTTHIPLVVRYQLDERFALGLGGYADFLNQFPSGTHDRDFGLMISARASLPVIPRFRFIIDGRYQHGLSNLSNIPPGTIGDYLNTRNMQAYLGVSYLLSI